MTTKNPKKRGKSLGRKYQKIWKKVLASDAWASRLREDAATYTEVHGEPEAAETHLQKILRNL